MSVRSVGGSSESQVSSQVHIHQMINVTGNGDKALVEVVRQGAELGAREGESRAICANTV
ncbi:MAG: hypothetical protein ACL7BU_05720 [Candidatus Phlomobacter fragariae]